jgi:hypothetical protein
MKTLELTSARGHVDRRRTRRHQTLKGATITVRDGFYSLSCQILDTSERGVLIRVVDFSSCPNHFVLTPRFDAPRQCEVVWRKGELHAGLRRLDDALAELERTKNRWYEAEIYRIRAEILLKRNPADTTRAEQALQAAIAIAQSQKARSFELRAALSLAKLYRAAHRDADAHAVLAPAVEGFPPTQHFPELAAAQALLGATNG